MREKIWAFITKEDGQTSTEYILLVAVVAFIIFKFKGLAAPALENITTKVFGKASEFVDNVEVQ